jgi:chemotaxis protein CheD
MKQARRYLSEASEPDALKKGMSDLMNRNKPKFNPAALTRESLTGFEEEVDFAPGIPRHFLYPGQIFVTREITAISTILGSCAAVCLWDHSAKIGGMNHYLLPEGPEDSPNRLRYGNVANPELLQKMLALGCEVKDLQAKIFGGASAFSPDPTLALGMKNVALAEEFLKRAGIPIIAKDVVGKHGRKLTFHTGDGSVLLKNYGPAQSSEQAGAS